MKPDASTRIPPPRLPDDPVRREGPLDYYPPPARLPDAPSIPEGGEGPSEPSYRPHALYHELTGLDTVRLSVQNNGTQLNRQRTLNFGTGLTATEDNTNKRITITTTALKAVKSSNETVTSSTTLQNDDALVIALVANTSYVFECGLFYNADAAGDLKLAFTVPSGATLTWSGIGLVSTAAGQLDIGSQVVVTGSGSTQVYGGLGAASNMVLWIGGTVIVGSTAGNLQLQWAQNASSATATTVLAGSYLFGM